MRYVPINAFALLVLFMLLGPAAFAEDGGPISLNDVRDLRRQRKSFAEIVEVMRKRGIDFEVSASAERRLRTYGFRPRLIDQIKKMGAKNANEKAGGAEKAGPEKQEPAAEQPNAKPQLDPATEAQHARLADQVERMIEKSETTLVKNSTKHVTLVASKKVVSRFKPDIMTLEGKLKERFPEPIASGVDLRAANIALLETRYEYEKWVRALFKVFEEDGYQFQGEDPLKSSLATNSFFVRGIYSVCLEGMSDDEARRRLSFAVGFQYMRQLTRHKAPDAIATGFGNLTEAMMFQRPSIMVKSGYTDRELGGLGTTWAQLVRQRFLERKIGSIQNVLVYSLSSMQPPEYAEAWSLTSLLSTNGQKLADLIVALRGEESAWESIKRIYEVEEQAMLTKWRNFAAAQR